MIPLLRIQSCLNASYCNPHCLVPVIVRCFWLAEHLRSWLITMLISPEAKVSINEATAASIKKDSSAPLQSNAFKSEEVSLRCKDTESTPNSYRRAQDSLCHNLGRPEQRTLQDSATGISHLSWLSPLNPCNCVLLDVSKLEFT